MIKVLFVCLGNICRSPVAEGIFKYHIAKKNLTTQFLQDSAGTAAYHIGEIPYHISRRVAKEHGVFLDHLGRQFSADDFKTFEYIICMDKNNYRDVLKLAVSNDDRKKVYLMRQWEFKNKFLTPEEAEPVPDPYFGNESDFTAVHKLLDSCVLNLIDHLQHS